METQSPYDPEANTSPDIEQDNGDMPPDAETEALESGADETGAAPQIPAPRFASDQAEGAPTPSKGRIVMYQPRLSKREDAVPAIVTTVHSDTCVNLRVFADEDSYVARVTSVEQLSPHNQHYGAYWFWPERV